jgi:muconolactone delta-isomerase
MEFLVEFVVTVPEGTPESEVEHRQSAEAAASARLAQDGHLVRVWKAPASAGATKALGLYRADTHTQLDGLLAALPLFEWMRITVTALQPHANDPARRETTSSSRNRLPDPRLTRIFRLEASVGQPLDLGATATGHRRIVPLTGGKFTGPDINGTLLPGSSADWQVVLPDGTTLGDIRYTLQTDRGDVLYVQSRGVRHGRAAVLARLARGEDVDAGEYTFRTSTRIETGARDLDWLNKGVFISVGGRQAGGVLYEIYLVA